MEFNSDAAEDIPVDPDVMNGITVFPSKGYASRKEKTTLGALPYQIGKPSRTMS